MEALCIYTVHSFSAALSNILATISAPISFLKNAIKAQESKT
jgi:hypothetical protein